eukprot:1323892-Amphidinium_carterae.1
MCIRDRLVSPAEESMHNAMFGAASQSPWSLALSTLCLTYFTLWGAWGFEGLGFEQQDKSDISSVYGSFRVQLHEMHVPNIKNLPHCGFDAGQRLNTGTN